MPILEGRPVGCSEKRTLAIDPRAPINSCLDEATQPPVTCDAPRRSQAADNHWAPQGQLVSAASALHLQLSEKFWWKPRAVTSGGLRGRSIAMSSIHHRDTNLALCFPQRLFVASQANSGVFVLCDCLRSDCLRSAAPQQCHHRQLASVMNAALF